MADNIWVVEQGEYSDYRVVGVFTSEENAQIVADTINKGTRYNKASVAEWPLDPAVSEINQGLYQYNVIMRRDGTAERVQINEISGYDIAGEVRMWRRTKASAYRNDPTIEDAMMATVWASDPTHAVKIVNEHRAQFIASCAWEND